MLLFSEKVTCLVLLIMYEVKITNFKFKAINMRLI